MNGTNEHEGREEKLIPFTEIDDRARNIAVEWIENYEPMGFDIQQKHKLASDIMNYATSLREQLAQAETQSHDQVNIIEHLEKELASERALIKRFVDSMALLEVELLKERALRKELVDGLHLAWTYVNEGGDMLMDTDAKKVHTEFRAAAKEIRALLQKSKSLDEKK